MLLYKYRGFSNIEFALDIFVNKRLFAANFKQLNDPMEGRFIYSKGSLNKVAVKEIRGGKATYNILSLSETESNMLMWSYYADGHSGFVVGVELTEDGVTAEPVSYVEDLRLEETHGDVAKQVLTKKLQLWEHEKERRVLVQGTSYVNIEVRKLVFGTQAGGFKKELLTRIAEKFCPSAEITTIRRQDLDLGEVEEEDI